MKKIICLIMFMMITVNVIGCSKATDTKQDVDATKQNNETTKDNAEETKEASNETAKATSFDNLYPDFIQEETETNITYVDKFGTETTVTKKT